MRNKTTKTELEKTLNTALKEASHIALKAGDFIQSKFGKFKNLNNKADSTLVTEVDQKAEQIILSHLQKKFPSHSFIGEETGKYENQSPFRWHIDPLDGTSNFVHKFPFFCVSIGLEFIKPKSIGKDNHLNVLGVIYQPTNKNLYTAKLGSGAFLNKKRFYVSKIASLKQSLLCTGFSFKRDETFMQEMQTFASVAYQSHSIRRTGSAALDLTYVALGNFDGFWERALNSWDVAAGITLVQEAGGTITNVAGKPYTIGDSSIVASNGKIHSQLITALNKL